MRHNKKAAKRRFAHTGEEKLSFGSILKGALYALLIAGGIGALLLLLCTALLLLTKSPLALVTPTALGALCATALAAGAVAARLQGNRLPLFCGLTTGGLFLLLLLAVAICLPKGQVAGDALRAGIYAAIPLLTTVGAMLAARKKKTVKHRKRAF